MARKVKKPQFSFSSGLKLTILFIFALVFSLATASVLARYINLVPEPTKISETPALQLLDYEHTLTGADLIVFRLWNRRIDEVGAHKAYEEFKAAYIDGNTNDAHTYSHVFGILLYLKTGIHGVSVCDDTFAYGCFHSYMAKALQDQGTGVITSLNEHCVNKLIDINAGTHGCQHGIGHGLLSYFGYNIHSVKHSLDICHRFLNVDDIRACDAGVYMEYDFRTMLLDEGPSRVLTEQNVLEPCTLLPEEYQLGCYYWHTQWFIDQGKGDYDAVFTEIGRICDKIKNPAYNNQCYSGVGHFLGQYVDWNVSEGVKACQKFAPYGKDKEDKCRSEARDAYIFYGVKDLEAL